MAERPNKFPTLAQIRTGDTLPLGGGSARDDDESTKLPLTFGANVARQRIVFVNVQHQVAIPREPPTLKGLGGGDAPADLEWEDALAALDLRQPIAAGIAEVVQAGAAPSSSGEEQPPRSQREDTGEFLDLAQTTRWRADMGAIAHAQPPLAAPDALSPEVCLDVPSDALRVDQKPRLVFAGLRKPARRTGSRERRLVLLGVVLSGLCVAGWTYPLHLNAVAPCKFERYAQADVVLSPTHGQVRTLEVRAGQHVQVGTPLLGFDDRALVRERADLYPALEAAQTALSEAQAATQAEVAANAAKYAKAWKAISQRVAEKRGELASLELKRDELIRAQARSYVSPLSLAALDDRVDIKRAELRTLAAEQASLRQPSAARPAREAELSQQIELLHGRLSALENMLAATAVRADRDGVIVGALPAPGSVIEERAPLYKIIPDAVPLVLITSFRDRYAHDLERADSLMLQPSAAQPARARALRVACQPGQLSCEVELMLLDVANGPQLTAAIEQGGVIQAELPREITLFRLVVERLRAAVSAD